MVSRAFRLVIKSAKWCLIAFGIFLAFVPLWVGVYKWVNPPVSNLTLIRWAQDSKKAPLYNLQKKWVKLDEISPYLLQTILLHEDPRFYHHKGFFFGALYQGLKQSLSGKKNTPGFSTITQQTAKNLFLYPYRSYLRKALEVYFAFWMEKIWGKKRILEIYLNIIEYGEGIFGIETASQHFFSKPAKQVCFDEACLLAAILFNPIEMDPLKPNTKVMWRASLLYRKCIKSAAAKKDAPPLHSGRKRPAFI